MRAVATIIVVLTATAAVGCGSNSDGCGSNPTGPGCGGGQLEMMVPSQGVLFLGEDYTFGMRATMPNGQVVTTGGTWGSDAPPVATVEATTGIVRIVGLGAATIYVDYSGMRALRTIDTTVQYAGGMDGVHRVTRCVDTGDWAAGDACDEFKIGSTMTFAGTFTQVGRSVTATMLLDSEDITSPVAAEINGAGELRFGTTHSLEEITGAAQWFLKPSGLTRVQGSTVARFTFPGLSGYVEVSADIPPVEISHTISAAADTRAQSFGQALARVVLSLRR